MKHPYNLSRHEKYILEKKPTIKNNIMKTYKNNFVTHTSKDYFASNSS
jgi:hypothetical protein